MFWGVTILPNRRYTQTVEKTYHISKATLEVVNDDGKKKESSETVGLMLEHQGKQFLLCNLSSNNPQTALDLIFTETENLTFFLKGEGTVHLTGYYLDFESDDDDEDEDGFSDEELQDVAVKRKTIDEEKGSVSKKAKLNGKQEEVDDEESDDDDVLGELDDEEDEDEEDDEADDEEDDEEEETLDSSAEGKAAAAAAKPQQNGQVNAKQDANKNVPAKNSNNAVNNKFQKPQQNQQKFGKGGANNKFGGNQNQNTPNKFGGNQNQNSPNKFGGGGGFNKGNNQQNKFGNFQQKNQGGFGGGKPGNTPFNNKQQNQHNKPKGSFTPNNQKLDNWKQLNAGLKINDIHEGNGPLAKKGKLVHVRYVGRLPNNKEFDRSTNKPFSFKLGSGQVIKGWDIGIEGMKVGGKRKLIIPPNMGYGNKSTGPIPAHSTLNFEVELVSVT